MLYNPGTHLIASLHTENVELLEEVEGFKKMIDEQIQIHGLHKLGEVYHSFHESGITAVICLSESHISIHTWPEFGKINMDIYLSNHLQCNDGKVAAIYSAISEYFAASVESEQFIKR